MKIKIRSWDVDGSFDHNELRSLPTEMEVPDDLDKKEVKSYVSDIVGVPVCEYSIVA